MKIYQITYFYYLSHQKLPLQSSVKIQFILERNPFKPRRPLLKLRRLYSIFLLKFFGSAIHTDLISFHLRADRYRDNLEIT